MDKEKPKYTQIPTSHIPLSTPQKCCPQVLQVQALSHTFRCFLHPPQVMTRSNKAHTDTPYRNNPLKEAEKTERLASKTHTDTSGNPWKNLHLVPICSTTRYSPFMYCPKDLPTHPILQQYKTEY
jgi:hypothetical protein